MSEEPEFDLAAAHKFFSAHCFNTAWDLIDKTERTPEENEQMIQLSLASAWHWGQRKDCTDANLSVSYWQISRVYALLGQVENARRYGQICLEISRSEDVGPFYLGYAYEALARAESVAGNHTEAKAYVSAARLAAEKVEDVDSRKWLLDDLATIEQ